MGTVLKVILYALLMIFVFGILIFIHELGHFMTARRFGVTIKEFAIGMGPTVFSRTSKKYGTKYALRLLPIGGFVSMVGEDEASEDENAFCNKKVWKRMIIIIAGATMNLLLGFLLIMVLVLAQPQIGSNVYAGTIDNSKIETLKQEYPEMFAEYDFEAFPLQRGDKIVSVDGTMVFTYNDVSYELMNKGYEPIEVVVKRNNEKIPLTVTLPVQVDQASGTKFGYTGFMTFFEEEKNVVNVIKQTAFRSVSSVKMVYDSIIGLISGRFGMEAISGPIGVAETVGDAAKSGVLNFIYIVAILTINLGVINLVPFPALDGGRFLLLIVEGIRRKPLNRKLESYINFAGIVVLFAFMIFISFKDIIKLIFR